jgi:cation diffusion facilitator family transporter
MAPDNKTGSLAQERTRVTKRVTLVGSVINLVLSVLKIAVGIVSQSQALIADGIHSLSDLLSDALVYVAAHHAQNEPDEQHPYGHGRFETAATLGLALLLFLVAAGLIWDATQRLFAPETLMHPGSLALFAAAFSVAIKEWLYHYTRIAARRVRSEMMRANAWHHRSDAISSIVVLIGVGGTMAGLPYLDAVGAVVVGVMIGHIGWELGWGSMQELVDTGLDGERIEEIRTTILAVGGVKDIHMLRTRRLGGHASADVHVLVEPGLSVSEGHMISLMVEQSLKQEIDEIEDVTVHIDPEDDETAPPCVGLPLRSQLLPSLRSAWSEIPAAQRVDSVMLHYLNGKVGVDLFFSTPPCESGTEDVLLQQLQQAANSIPEVGQIRMFLKLNDNGATTESSALIWCNQ